MFFSILILAIIVTGFVVYWAMKQAYQIGHDDLAFGLSDPLAWINIIFIESVMSISFALVIILLSDTWMPIFSIIAASLSSKLLIGAMIIEGMRIRRDYYTSTIPWREGYLRFSKDEVVRPPFLELWRMW